MSKEEQNELSALAEWLATFPQVEQFTFDKENSSLKANVEYLSSPGMASAILDVALEVCDVGDSDTTFGHADDVWDTVWSLTRKAPPNRRKSLEPPQQDTPHRWPEYSKYSALSNLLTVAVSHKDLQLRKSYIQRIMTLTSGTQRLLMALIERRKKASTRSRTPSKKDRHHSSSTKKRSKDNSPSNACSPADGATPGTTASATTPAPGPYKDSFKSQQTEAPNTISRIALSPFRLGKSGNGKTPEPPASHFSTMHGMQCATTSEKKKQEKRGGFLTTPNFLRRTFNENEEPAEDSRRTFPDTFASPLQQSSVKRLPPPSSERVKIGKNMFSPGLGDTAEYEAQVQSLRDEKDDLSRELGKSRQKEEELSRKMEDMEISFRKEMIKVEREARERDDTTRDEYRNHISQIQTELIRVSEECAKARNERDELAKIKDEMEVMSHAKSLLEETTERLRTYKEKVQHLSDFKEALQREEEAHSRSVQENLRLQNELQSLQPLKRQLEEYKGRVVDAEVKFTECHDELVKLKETKVMSNDVNTQMEQYVLAQEEEIRELRRRVQQNEQAGNEGSGVGDGISELNPELKAEVLSLRNETAQLRSFAEKRQYDEVVKLEQEAEDKARLAERYKTQFLSTKDKLETTQASLQESRNREAKLRADLAESLSKIQDTQQEVEEVSTELLKCTEDMNQSLARESKLEEELTTWAGEAKNLQEHANDLSRRLKKSHVELDESLNRETSLLKELDDIKRDLVLSGERCCEILEALDARTAELQQSKNRESKLEICVAEWTERTRESHEHATEVSSQLMRCNHDLETSQQAEIKLAAELKEANAMKNQAEQRIDSLLQELKDANETLQDTQQELEQNKQREVHLLNEITDLACRVEDAEAVSRQRMELVQNTREKLQASEDTIAFLEKAKEELVSSVDTWTKKAKDAEKDAESLESDLEETRHSLNDTEEKLAESQALVLYTKNENETLTQCLAELRDSVAASETLTGQLQEELTQTREILISTQDDAKSLKARETLANEQLEHAEQMLFELEDAVDSEVKARNEMVAKHAALEAENKEIKEIFESREKELMKELDSEKKGGETMKQDISKMKETLNALQVSLGASQHREKMLKHEVSKMKDAQQEIERDLLDAENQMKKMLEESSKSLESIGEKLAAKAQKDLDEVQQNMNQLLEDERRAKRQQEEFFEEKVSKLAEKHERDITRLKQDSKGDTERSKKEYELEFHRMKGAYEEKLILAERSANEEKAKLMTKGKGMLKDLKEKLGKDIENLTDDVAFLEEKIMKEEEEKTHLGIQFQTKLVEYKKKLQVAANRINSLSTDNSDFEERVKRLERERFKLREENDRYRRQLGGRSGSDSILETQMETLQAEFKNALDENRELKRKLQSQGQSTLLSISEDMGTKSYMRNGSNHSTLTQLRTEYEETIDSLNSEKRELVMKNSAAITDVQKAEKRAWLVEQENSTLKQELTSMKLSNERLENMLSNTQGVGGHGGQMSSSSNVSMAEITAIPMPPSGDESDSEQYAPDKKTASMTVASKSVISWPVSNTTGASLNSQSNNDWDRADGEGILAPNQALSNIPSDQQNGSVEDTKTPGKTARFTTSFSSPGFTSPDQDIKSFVQSTTLHTPYKRTGTSKYDPPDCKQS